MIYWKWRRRHCERGVIQFSTWLVLFCMPSQRNICWWCEQAFCCRYVSVGNSGIHVCRLNYHPSSFGHDDSCWRKSCFKKWHGVGLRGEAFDFPWNTQDQQTYYTEKCHIAKIDPVICGQLSLLFCCSNEILVVESITTATWSPYGQYFFSGVVAEWIGPVDWWVSFCSQLSFCSFVQAWHFSMDEYVVESIRYLCEV